MREAFPAFLAFAILIVVVVAGTGPWSHLGDYTFVKPEVDAISSLSHKPVPIPWKFAPAIAGTWILISLLLILAALRVGVAHFMAALKRSFSQTWGALLVAPIVFGLATAPKASMLGRSASQARGSKPGGVDQPSQNRICGLQMGERQIALACLVCVRAGQRCLAGTGGGDHAGWWMVTG